MIEKTTFIICLNTKMKNEKKNIRLSGWFISKMISLRTELVIINLIWLKLSESTIYQFEPI